MRHIQFDIEKEQSSFPVAIVVSLFNREITQELVDGAINRLTSKGISSDDITLIDVPGAIEIPLLVQQLAKTKEYSVIIALGAVIRGETTHYDYVCEQVSMGLQRVALDYDLPVIFGVLTTENESQAWDRLGGKHGHKGMDAADAALAMQRVLQLI